MTDKYIESNHCNRMKQYFRKYFFLFFKQPDVLTKKQKQKKKTVTNMFKLQTSRKIKTLKCKAIHFNNKVS